MRQGAELRCGLELRGPASSLDTRPIAPIATVRFVKFGLVGSVATRVSRSGVAAILTRAARATSATPLASPDSFHNLTAIVTLPLLLTTDLLPSEIGLA
jgi:hypothetical protein